MKPILSETISFITVSLFWALVLPVASCYLSAHFRLGKSQDTNRAQSDYRDCALCVASQAGFSMNAHATKPMELRDERQNRFSTLYVTG